MRIGLRGTAGQGLDSWTSSRPQRILQNRQTISSKEGLSIHHRQVAPIKQGCFKISQLIKTARAPLVVIGKGAVYARAEGIIRELDDKTQIPFFPSPIGKGVLPDSHLQNTSFARSTVLQLADVILILGARLH